MCSPTARTREKKLGLFTLNNHHNLLEIRNLLTSNIRKKIISQTAGTYSEK